MISSLLVRPLEKLFGRLYGLQKLYVPAAILIIYMAVLACNLGTVYLYIGYAILMVYVLISMRWHEFYMVHSVVPLIVFTVYCFASAMWAESQDDVFDRAAFILIAVGFTLVMSNYFIQKKSLDTILISIAVSGVIVSLYVIGKYHGLAELVRVAEEGERAGSEIVNVNDIGMTCAYSAVVMLCYIIVRKKYVNIPFLIFTVIVALTTASRKALLILVVGDIVKRSIKERCA